MNEENRANGLPVNPFNSKMKTKSNIKQILKIQECYKYHSGKEGGENFERSASMLLTFIARCQRYYNPNEVNNRSEDTFKATNINTK